MQHRQFKDGSYMLRVMPGEEVVSAITAFINDKKIHAGSLTAIGAAHEVEIGYWDGAKRIYLKKKLPGTVEILAMTGNISRTEDGKAFMHAHAVLGDRDMNTFGGHLFSAIAEPTCEVSLRPQDGVVERKLEPEIGLRLLQL